MVHTCISRYKQTELEYPVSTFQDTHIGGSRTIVAEGPWCFSVDLKDAYWYVSINKNFQQYLGFMFKGQVYCFVALPYGLNIAPRIFTLIMKDFLGWASRRGMVCAIYLDDLLVMAPTQAICQSWKVIILEELQQRGLFINWEKSMLIPSQKFVFLGRQWIMEALQVCRTLDNVTGTIQGTLRIAEAQWVSRSSLSTLLGKLNFAALVVTELK